MPSVDASQEPASHSAGMRALNSASSASISGPLSATVPAACDTQAAAARPPSPSLHDRRAPRAADCRRPLWPQAGRPTASAHTLWHAAHAGGAAPRGRAPAMARRRLRSMAVVSASTALRRSSSWRRCTVSGCVGPPGSRRSFSRVASFSNSGGTCARAAARRRRRAPTQALAPVPGVAQAMRRDMQPLLRRAAAAPVPLARLSGGAAGAPCAAGPRRCGPRRPRG